MKDRYEAWYQRISTGLRRQPGFVSFLIKANDFLTVLFYLLYPLFILYLFWIKDPGLGMSILIPGAGFILVSAVRSLIGRTRPYAACRIEPLILKKSEKDSMPSRHVFSATMITMVIGAFFPAAGVILFGCCILLAVVRVLTGIHYPSDVTVGLLLGIAGGIVFYMLV